VTYEPLHHKYRPQTFAELVGQGAIAHTLSNALGQQRIAPAYLFTGARGTGKTSSARIFAKSLNCLNSDVPTDAPCGLCEVCRAIAKGSALDVIEIDAASNTGVDNIRELIERAQFAPVQCRYKVYIIDEVHMLSTAAFNALLKTLEEPPDRVVFVLATTDPQRVLPTIISRCQRFDFRRIPLDDMVAHLKAIATKEAIDITIDAVQLVAQISQGGLRDAESLLDQLSLLQGQITVERVWDLVGAVPERDLLELVRAIAQDDPSILLETTRQLMDRGREPLVVLQNLASFYRDLLIAKTAPSRNDLVAITPPTWAEMCQFASAVDIGWILAGQTHLKTSEVQVKTTSQPRLWLEVTLMGLLPSAVTSQPTTTSPQPNKSFRPQVGTNAQKPAASPSSTNGRSLTPPVTPTAEPVTTPPTEHPAPTAHSIPKAANGASFVEPPPVVADEQSHTAQDHVVEHPVVQSTNTQSNRTQETAAEAAASSSASTNVHQIWQDVLALMQPFSTQIMLRQQCHLIAFNGQEARIGVNSQPLFKMAKDRVANIEAAFQQYTNQVIRVTLEVAAPTAQPEAIAPSTPNAPPTPAKEQPSTYSAPPPPPPSEHGAATNGVAVNGAPKNGAVGRSPMPPPQPSASKATDPAAAPQVPWQDDDEVKKAAKLFAQMFNGQIVSLDGETEPIQESLSEEPLVRQGAGSLDATDDEDDDDVPF
jgi:DNA polymerase III subunit gamma/tau